MRKGLAAATLFSLATANPVASDIVLAPPIACDLGADCFIQQYFDHDPTGGAHDYRCAPLSYDDHKGTDFALRTLAQMQRGVNVVASAPGTVLRTRNGMQDRIHTQRANAQVSGLDCGNGLVIDHGSGWTTQYCHLKRGSVAVRPGDRVQTGTVLGQVGLSGRTQFPHVHLSVRKDGRGVDPFDPDGRVRCGAPSARTLWDRPLPYRPGGVLEAGFADAVPQYDAVKAGRAAQSALPADAPALVLFGYVFGGQRGDRMRLTIQGPQGPFMDEMVTLEKTQAQLFRAVGKRRTTAAWPRGTWSGTVTLIRNGREIDRQQSQVTVR